MSPMAVAVIFHPTGELCPEKFTTQLADIQGHEACYFGTALEPAHLPESRHERANPSFRQISQARKSKVIIPCCLE